MGHVWTLCHIGTGITESSFLTLWVSVTWITGACWGKLVSDPRSVDFLLHHSLVMVYEFFFGEEWKPLDFPLIFHYKPSILRDLPHDLGNPHWKTLKPMIEMFIAQSTSSCREISLEILRILLMSSNILCHRNPELIKLSCHLWLVVWNMFIFHNI